MPPIQSSLEKILDKQTDKKSIQIDGVTVDIENVGSLTNHDGRIILFKAMIRNGKCGKSYILMSPDINTIISNRKSFLLIDFSSLSELETQNSFQKLQKAQKILLTEGGIVVHWLSNRSVIDHRADKVSVSDQLTESVVILKALGFPKDYIFLVMKRMSAEVAIFGAAGFEINQFGN